MFSRGGGKQTLFQENRNRERDDGMGRNGVKGINSKAMAQLLKSAIIDERRGSDTGENINIGSFKEDFGKKIMDDQEDEQRRMILEVEEEMSDLQSNEIYCDMTKIFGSGKQWGDDIGDPMVAAH
ncbi:unnamed protein product [Ilex paraguariensis]|uniref:Uncharacterized protein n=1 Tax=Ilex paraguariensis TaxID=185542 RepID=A0ABC8RU51_9AQUA